MSSTLDPYVFANEAQIPVGVADCIRAIIENWDQVDDLEHSYLTGFSEDCDLYLPPYSAKGHAQIKALRLSTINSNSGPIINVRHTLGEIYIKAGNLSVDTVDSVWTGTITYTIIGGATITEDLATRTEMRREEGGAYKATRVRIFADTASLQSAIMAAMAAG